jgi:hypothetical protein
METFGRRIQEPAAPAAMAAHSTVTLVALAILAAMAALVAAHVWINVLQVSFVRPIGPLFNSIPASREGWAPWYVAPLVTAIVAFAVLLLIFRRPNRMTIVAFTGAGLGLVVLAATMALWVKNVGYTWYFVPGTTVAMIANVVWQMLGLAFGRAVELLIGEPLLVLAGAAIGAMLGRLAGLPLGAHFRRPPIGARADATTTQESPVAGPPAILWTGIVMVLFAGLVAAREMPPGAILVMPLIGLVWWFVSFRGGRYEFLNVLLGSAAIGFLSSLPLLIGLHSIMGVDVSVVLLATITRGAVMLVLSIILIKVAIRKAGRTALAS